MAILNINPYSFIATDYANGMNQIGSVLAPVYPNQTLDEIVDTVYAYVVTNYMEDAPPILQERTLKSTIKAIVSGYVNLKRGDYIQFNVDQTVYVKKLIDGTLNLRNPEDILQHIQNVEDCILQSKLDATQQMPLLYTTAIGKSAYSYWSETIATPGNWSNFINTFTPPIIKFPIWVTSSMEGTLIALSLFHNTNKGRLAAELELLLNYAGANIILAIYGSLSVGAAKVALKLEQRPSENCECDMSDQLEQRPDYVPFN